jgi:GT2 family glycosyltransferase
MTAPKTEVIIVSWNGREDTLRAVDSVASQQISDVLITVVDNGSSDGTAEAVLKRHPQVRLLRLHRNQGFTGGITVAATASSARYLVFLNNDAVAEPGWLGSLIGALDQSAPDVAAVGGKIVDSSATLVDFIGGILTFDGHALQTGFRKRLDSVSEPSPGSELLFACGGNMIVRRDTFLELGGFDEDYFAYLEDVDFGWRAWLSGHRMLYEPLALVRHRSSATSDRLGNFERGVLFERNALQTAIKNYDQESFQRFSGPIFLTLLHRLHHYLITQNRNVDLLTRPPFGDAPDRGRRRRGRAVVDDELTAMQFRAIHWFFENQERLVEKRQSVQRRRKRSDREIFERFPVHFVPTYPGDRELMQSTLFRLLQPPVPSAERKLEDLIRT